MTTDPTLTELDKLREKLRERPMRMDLDPVRSRVEQLLDETGKTARPTVLQVVGSNGKGSVVHYLSSLLASEKSVVSFTSPHLIQPGDRIKTNGTSLTPRELNDALASFGKGFLDDYTPFEALLLVALQRSLETGSDFLVLEAGMGGRWDATSAIQPEWVILTSIDLEHTEYLGSDRRSILEEKLAQVPDHGKIITGFLDHPDSQDGLNSMIETKNLTHVGLDEPTGPEETNRRLALLGARFLLDTPARTLSGRLDGIGPPPGRQEFHRVDGRTIVFDVAHTPAAIEALVDRLREETTERQFLLYGSLKGKETDSILRHLRRGFDADRTVLTEPDSPRALEAEQLLDHWRDDDTEPAVIPDPTKGFQRLLERSAPGDLILVSGSFNLIGNLREQVDQ